jgi:TRAP-type mannitol/chloroaromatic compound transport system permease small subunit
MSESVSSSARPTDPVGRALFDTAKILAIVGGGLISVTAIMVTVSVTGRYLFAAPIPGDYDLIAILCGCSVFAFLPYCQMTRGNVVVDFFTTNINFFARTVLDAFGTLLYLLIAVLFTWRLVYGGLELHSSGEVLANFNFYRWWTIPFDLLCMLILILVIAYTLSRDIADIRKGGA